MTPELQAECDQVFAHWKANGKYDEACFLCLLSERQTAPDAMRNLAAKKFEAMYDEAIKQLGLTPVLEPCETQASKYVWRNGARVKL